MDDWTRDQWKKYDEAAQFALFADAYEQATGETLEIEAEAERPDFICLRSDGVKMGVELNKVVRSPDDALWQGLIERQDLMDSHEALERIRYQLIAKEQKRSEADWQLPDNTILVFELIDISLAEMGHLLSPESLPDLEDVGFAEVWLADYSEVEAYGGVELFALRHSQLYGHQQLNKDKKPWG